MDTLWSRTLQCGRRMFLAALILASKYLQDRNSARAWSEISGVRVCEINTDEIAFLQAVNRKLHVPVPLFERWQDILYNVIKYTKQQPPSPSPLVPTSTWRSIVLRLTPELDKFSDDSKPFKHRALEPLQDVPVTISITDISITPIYAKAHCVLPSKI